MTMPAILVTEDAHWWSLRDHQAVVDVVQQTGARHVLEFGPGTSTLSLIQGGAVHIDTCEDDSQWADVHEARVVKMFPGIVYLHRYEWATPLSIPQVDNRIYDLALIDGPRSAARRPEVLRYCLDRALWVLMPTEDGASETALRPVIQAAALATDRHVEWMETGPLAGGFALVGPC